ncbi:MAG: hypothetical protein QXL96_07750 [Ignisphaera sp.]
MPCPWYQYGLCTSPKLPEPTDAVVAVDRCNSDNMYVNCLYYYEEGPQKSIPRRSSATRRDKSTKIYVPIHAIPAHLDCQCPECEISTTENGLKIAYCKALDRHLSRYEVYLCSRYWKDCPYRYLQPI